MGWFRARATVLTLIVGTAVLAARAQADRLGQGSGAQVERHVIRENVGLAAVDEGLIADETHAPGTREALRRAAKRVALHQQSTQPAARYAAGRVLVKFRDAMSPTARLKAVQQISRSATIDPRPAFADFDLVRIDTAENPETVATALGDRADVEYAQAAYSGWHSLMVPNDPLYAT